MKTEVDFRSLAEPHTIWSPHRHGLMYEWKNNDAVGRSAATGGRFTVPLASSA